MSDKFTQEDIDTLRLMARKFRTDQVIWDRLYPTKPASRWTDEYEERQWDEYFKAKDAKV
jgi:hypothetical protein